MEDGPVHMERYTTHTHTHKTPQIVNTPV